MSWIPAQLVQPPEGDNRTYVTAALPPDMVERLEQVLDTALRTHPRSTAQDIVDVVMCAGIEAVSSDSYTAISTACAQRDTYRRALRKIAALPEAAPAREAIGIAEQALQHQTT